MVTAGAAGPAVALVLLGAACMYFWDPELGADRRDRLVQGLTGLREDALAVWERVRGLMSPSNSHP
jgi:hypothetical protein